MKMVPLDIVDGSYADEDKSFSAQDTVNYLPTSAEQGGTRTPTILKTPPGLRPAVLIGSATGGEPPVMTVAGPVRGTYNAEGRFFAVAGNTLYQITSKGVSVPLGTVPGIGRVSFSHNQITNGNEILVNNGNAGYIYNTVTQVFQRITDTSYPGGLRAVFINNRFVQIEPARRYVFNSDLADGLNYNALDRFTSETSPDLVVGIESIANQLAVFNTGTVEWFEDTGANPQPFRSTGIVADKGAAGPFTTAKMDNALFMFGSDGIFYRFQGYNPIRISTKPIEQAVRNLDWNNCFTTVWINSGYSVCYWTFPNGQTWGYDASTNKWHRRESYGFNRWRLNSLTYWQNQYYGGDFQNGRLWLLDWDYQLEGDQEFECIRAAGVISDNQNRVIHERMELVMDTGMKETIPVPFGTQPIGPSISGEAPDAGAGDAYSFAYTVTPGGSPISRTVLLPGSYIVVNGETKPIPNDGWAWNQSTATISNPSPPITSVVLKLRVYDQNGLYADHNDVIEIVTFSMVLVVGEPSGVGQPMFAEANFSSAGSGTFSTIPLVSGADIENASCLFDEDRWVVINRNSVRIGSLDLTSWSSGTVPSTPGTYTTQLVNGPAGLAVSLDGFYVEDSPGDFVLAPKVSVTPGHQSALSSTHRIFSDGQHYYTSESYYLFRTLDPRDPWETIFDGGDQAITRFSATQRDDDGILWAVNMRGVSAAQGEIRWSPDGGVTWPNENVVVSQPSTGSRPAQLARVGAHLVAFCSNGNVWTSANNWESVIVTGLPAPGSGTYHVDINGYPHIADIGGNAIVVSGDKYVTINLNTLEVSSPATLPISNVSGIAARNL